jgi:hypothetical protein
LVKSLQDCEFDNVHAVVFGTSGIYWMQVKAYLDAQFSGSIHPNRYIKYNASIITIVQWPRTSNLMIAWVQTPSGASRCVLEQEIFYSVIYYLITNIKLIL